MVEKMPKCLPRVYVSTCMFVALLFKVLQSLTYDIMGSRYQHAALLSGHTHCPHDPMPYGSGLYDNAPRFANHLKQLPSG